LTTVGRFFLLQSVQETYDKILYLDGDIWPVGDISKLLSLDIPEGFIAAAEDRSYYWQTENSQAGRAVRDYFSKLGIDGELGYFNAGVMLAHSNTWREISAEAFEFFKDNMSRCLFHDQSALNVVAATRRVRLNPKWNFLYDYYDWRIKPFESPEIIHFCGPRKPCKLANHPFFKCYELTRQSLIANGLPELSQRKLEQDYQMPAWVRLKHTAMTKLRNIFRRQKFLQIVKSSYKA
jgi:lipopolysaccharide biosynthesis glycosyltransferase